MLEEKSPRDVMNENVTEIKKFDNDFLNVARGVLLTGAGTCIALASAGVARMAQMVTENGFHLGQVQNDVVAGILGVTIFGGAFLIQQAADVYNTQRAINIENERVSFIKL